MKNKKLIDSLSGLIYFFVCVFILKYFADNYEYSLLNVILFLICIGIYALILENIVSFIVEKYCQ